MATIDGALGAAATWAAAAVAGYLAAGLVVAVASRAGGGLGRCADATLLLYPRLVRLALRAAVATAVGGSALELTATAAAAAGVGGAVVAGTPTPPPVVAPARPAAEPLDWPVVTGPATGPTPATSGARRDQSAAAQTVLVRPGDCLWSLAARSLGPAATARQVAAAWPQWWAANRQEIGADPDRISPGLRLRVPPALERSSS